MLNFLEAFVFVFQASFHILGGIFNKTIIPLTFVGYEMFIANSALHTLVAIYHLMSNTPWWNDC